MSEKNPLIIIVLLAFASVAVGCSSPTDKEPHVKNLIFMIGDGMGLSQITAARLSAQSENEPFIFDQFPVVGLVHTQSSDDLVTDSAAAATALATGQKTMNGRISQDPDGAPLRTIIEACRDRGLATGLIATSSLTHATPAAFASHVSHRSHQTEIARQLVTTSQPELLLGGGYGYFIPSEQVGSFRSDSINLLDEARQQGYEIVQSARSLQSSSAKKMLGLFANKGLLNSAEEPTLADMTSKAIALFSERETGFCLIIEGSQIDWAAHHNDAAGTIEQTRFFENAMNVAHTFTTDRDDTLLIVTADHETGGMGIVHGGLDGSALEIGWLTKHHTAVDVPLFAIGAGAEHFAGVYDNTFPAKRLAELLMLRL